MRIERLSRIIGGTSSQGEVYTDYDTLVAAFGEPTYGPDGDPNEKVTCEWLLEIDGTVVTIYDWKEYGDTPRHYYDWHIGGHDRRAVDRVESIIREVENA